MAVMTNGGQQIEGSMYAIRIYWIIDVLLVTFAALLAVRAATVARGIGSTTSNMPVVLLLPLFVVLPAAFSIQSHRRLRRSVMGGELKEIQQHTLRRIFLQLIMFEYIALVWALSVLVSALH